MVSLRHRIDGDVRDAQADPFQTRFRHRRGPDVKAYRFDSFDSLDDLRVREEADPSPQRGEVLVRVHAVSLNFRDLAMLRGRYPRKCVPGLIPVSDAAGEVVTVGEGVQAFEVLNGEEEVTVLPTPAFVRTMNRLAAMDLVRVAGEA